MMVSSNLVRLLIIALSFQRPSSRLHIYLLICRTMLTGLVLTRKWNIPQSLGCAFLLASPILPPPFSIISFFCFFIFKFEASPEDFVNGLTSQLSLKQCGLGPPFLLFVYRGESTAPKGQLGPLALGRTRQVAPNFFTLVWWKPWWFFFSPKSTRNSYSWIKLALLTATSFHLVGSFISASALA